MVRTVEPQVWQIEQPPFWHSVRKIAALMFALNGIVLYWGCALGVLPALHYMAVLISLVLAGGIGSVKDK